MTFLERQALGQALLAWRECQWRKWFRLGLPDRLMRWVTAEIRDEHLCR